MLELFLSALALGFLFNVAPGAIFVASLRRGLAGGFFAALGVQIGSLVGDLVWALLGLGGVAVLFEISFLELPLALGGALLLAWLAYSSFKAARQRLPQVEPDQALEARSDLLFGAALSLTNPMNITYWGGLGGTITTLGVNEASGAAFGVFLAGFMLSSLLWCFICSGLISAIRRVASQGLWVALNLLCAGGLAYFAGQVLWRALAKLP